MYQNLPSSSRRRSLSPCRQGSKNTSRRRHHHSHHHESSKQKSKRQCPPLPAPQVVLPFNASKLSMNDLGSYRPMFGLYLDIQKQLIMEDLPEVEVMGRWKSFIRKWNRGELAEGWYDPMTKQKALVQNEDVQAWSGDDEQSTISRNSNAVEHSNLSADEASAEGDIGPPLPSKISKAAGPTVPTFQDLELRDVMVKEDKDASQECLRYQRAAHKAELLDQQLDFAPRADPGTHEHRIEKKREIRSALRSFRERKSPGADEVREPDLMGADDEGVDAFRRRIKEVERKKNDREIRRAEVLRARASEREEKLESLRRKEEETMEMLRELVKQRFG